MNNIDRHPIYAPCSCFATNDVCPKIPFTYESVSIIFNEFTDLLLPKIFK